MLHQEEVPCTLVFTKTIDGAPKLYTMCPFDEAVNMSLIQCLIHSMTREVLKDIIREDMFDSNA